MVADMEAIIEGTIELGEELPPRSGKMTPLSIANPGA